MKHLISNSLNEKSIINNIMSNSLNKVLLLTGVYGTGKTEFAKDVARMLTCENLTQDGYCGECGACKSEIVSGVNSFNTNVRLLNMETIDYEQMRLIVVDATLKKRSKNEVYIFDEFHLVDKKSQELWLAETAKLDDCYIIMTTTDKRSISDGILSRCVQINMKQLAPLEAAQLIKSHFPAVTDKVVGAMIKKLGGSPRELINHSVYYSNSGLDEQEIIHHLTNVNQQEVITCLEAMVSRELFFEELKIVRSMNTYTVKTILQDLFWDWLAMTPGQRTQVEYLSKYSEQQIMKFLVTSKDDPMLTILNMFKLVTTKKPINEDVTNATTNKVETVVSSKENFKKEETW